MNLAAEMQWDMLMPPVAFRSPEVAVAGTLEPAYSDGVTEARTPGGERFGLSRLSDLVDELIGSGFQVSEILRRLVRRLRDHRGAELEDDATLVFVEWQPGR